MLQAHRSKPPSDGEGMRKLRNEGPFRSCQPMAAIPLIYKQSHQAHLESGIPVGPSIYSKSWLCCSTYDTSNLSSYHLWTRPPLNSES